MRNAKVGFVCFGEVNTPFERLQLKHDEAIQTLSPLNYDLCDAGIVIDDPEYKTAKAAIEKLKTMDMDAIILCVAGWIPTHAVIYVTDVFRHVPMLLWGMCGWRENGKLITTADQAGTTAIRPALEAMDYNFKFIYSIVDKPHPVDKIRAFISAAHARAMLRSARVGTMGYRDMLLYGTQFEGNSMRGKIGVEVEPYEMYEMVQTIDTLDPEEVRAGIAFVKENWKIVKPCDDSVIENGVRYALSIVKKIRERGWEAITLIDVDGMKKLMGFPPAMVFMLLEHYCDVVTTPENDVMGCVTELIMKYISGATVPYLEYYEFFENSMLAGVPDYVPACVTDGDVTLLPAAFGLLSASLLNVSKVKPGYVTCARLIYTHGKYKMHVYTGTAKTPEPWNEFGWDDPAPQLPSLEIFPDSCTVEEFAQLVSCQHVIVAHGNHLEAVRDFCKMMDIELVM